MKTCTKCNKEKELNEFSLKKSSIDGYMSKCKECVREYNSLYYLNNKENFKVKNIKYNEENRENISLKKKEYYKNNKFNILDIRKEYYKDNIDKIKERDKLYQRKNREKINKYNSSYIKNKKVKSKIFKLTVNIRCLIYNSFKLKNTYKNYKTEEIIGCSFATFKDFIENKFDRDMTWENYGLWHLDHIIPISHAITNEDVYKLNHYTNFQPLWAYDNLSKGNRYIG